ncbi:MAG: hypothetical protein D6784_09405 [Chloroflexi bacterium]|nr:MAG: hypothetical protein D6784_09405 [Chloroflexota bacterium]
MDRTVPNPGNEEIDLYIRTYYSLLRSSGEIEVRSLEETHSGMNASLHQLASSPELDMAAFVYCAMRLPPCIADVRLVLLGQSAEVFSRGGYPRVEQWPLSKAPARRRKTFFDGQETLAVFINSISDIDDLIPMLTTYQIEWNKMHFKLHHAGFDPQKAPTEADCQAALGLDNEDFARLRQVWGGRLVDTLQQVARRQKRFALRLLAGSLTDYRRATQGWWRSVVEQCPVPDLAHRPVYFISSNMHVLPNLLSGYAQRIRNEIEAFLKQENPEGLVNEYDRLRAEPLPGAMENLLYYVMRKYLHTAAGRRHYDLRLAHEINLGIHNVRRPLNLDVGVQVIELSKLAPAYFDSRLQLSGVNWGRLSRSQALIVNVDYPLGMAAYQVLTQISANVGELRGVYIMGKAATLNGRVGDVMVPNVVFDAHSSNTYLFRNCFCAGDVAPYLNYGTVFDNQKAVTVRGTFLQNKDFMHVFYEEGYTDIEMEAGPYLSAVYENVYPKRYPVNEIVNLFLNLNYDVGILHYASDTPYSRRQSLLSKSMLYFGMDSSYAAATAILRRILAQETGRG